MFQNLKTQGGVNDISGVDIKDGEGSFADQGLIAFLQVGGIGAARNGWRVVDTANRDADFLGGLCSSLLPLAAVKPELSVR